jgi:hypothetical protein
MVPGHHQQSHRCDDGSSSWQPPTHNCLIVRERGSGLGRTSAGMCESDPAGASRRYENPRDAYQLDQAGIPVVCGAVKRLEVLGRGWSGPEGPELGRVEAASTPVVTLLAGSWLVKA